VAKSIYTYYKERLIEISGNNKCLYLKSIVRKGAYDIGKILEGREKKIADFNEFIFSQNKFPLTLISQKEKRELLENLGVDESIRKKSADITSLSEEDAKKAKLKNEKIARDEAAHALESEIGKLKDLKREIEEIEKETGRYELYIGYPFVFGALSYGGSKTTIKAPLLLIPARIDMPDEGQVQLLINENEKIRINPALVLAYAQAKKLSLDQTELEFDSLDSLNSVKAIVTYLEAAGVKIESTNSKNIYSYQRFKEPDTGRNGLSVRYGAVLGRFPLSNSIYNDYSLLEKKKLTTDAIDELLSPKKRKKKKSNKKQKKDTHCYNVKMLDYAQSEVVRKVEHSGNMVIYGPPGTGKSQTIVNIITDAVCKNKSVLVVSQKKAALDVVFNRLGNLNEKAMYLTDESKQKSDFYKRCLEAHQKDMIESLTDVQALEKQYDKIQEQIDGHTNELQTIFDILNTKRAFGLSLSEMYSTSYIPAKNSTEYATYKKLTEAPELLGMTYEQLRTALDTVKEQNVGTLYYNFLQDKEQNPIIDHMRPDLDINTLNEVKGRLEEIQRSKKGLFNTAKHPYYRQVLAYFYEAHSEKKLKDIVALAAKLQGKGGIFGKRSREEIREEILSTIRAIERFVAEYDCLHRVLTPDGYLAVIDNILRGNTSYVRLVREALDNYLTYRDINTLLTALNESMQRVLDFAYVNSKSLQSYNDILNSLMLVRIYHEITICEEEYKDKLAKLLDFNNITKAIYGLKEQQLGIASRICSGKNSKEYESLYNNAPNNKDYLYQISKKQKFWPIRKCMEHYSDFILSLFPCWLLSPENVSSLLPLKKDLFDLVIFDEASQVFIESTIPTIFRGTNIVVAGDAKQLRPSQTFMKRYMGADPELQEDLSVQAALEVDSLLDLAVSRYESANLTYHYRSRHRELIDFSNEAFYNGGLQIAPNISENKKERPIERHKVDGLWVNRHNEQEAKRVVSILKDIFKTRKNEETIGIITFNSDQQTCIADMIDKEAARDPEFRSYILKESNRKENGEDISLFVKNLENVQGDERDIIIFSIGYAPNESGRLYTNFGSLSAEGGENRLNVAITRAKSKIIVVTSIEPEELKIESAKHLGPKLLKEYLLYVRAVSKGDEAEVHSILAKLSQSDTKKPTLTGIRSIDEQMKERLEKLGYKVKTRLGNKNSRISLAVYDEESDRYLVGIELDTDAFASNSPLLERDVYKPRFIESRGWTVMRIFSRDWWISPAKVIKSITSVAERNRAKK
jgi:GTPase SAR1 family protein/very-short-patch-repair endonuclease